MRVFVSEFLSGGGVIPAPSTASMQREGFAMLHAMTEDLSRLPNCSVVTTLHANLPGELRGQVIRVEGPRQETDVFQGLLTEVDAVLVIAPETDRRLFERCRRVQMANVASWNCSPTSIELCSDKLRLSEHLQSNGLATIPTECADLDSPPDHLGWPYVLKPRDGAGSWLTFAILNRDHWFDVVEIIRKSGAVNKFIVQPFVPGRTLSVGVNISFDGQSIECLAVGEQRLSDDMQFRYLGGIIPAAVPQSVMKQIETLVKTTCSTISGLAGYIGFDLILDRQNQPIIVEINPRLTTAYIGYRQYYSSLLPERWLSPRSRSLQTVHESNSVEFDCSKF